MSSPWILVSLVERGTQDVLSITFAGEPHTQGLGIRELEFSALSARFNDINGAAVPHCQTVTITFLSQVAVGETHQVL